ncbi:MAG: hypothetical protein AB7I38_03925 [Dehalococcoidia bacterium]
MALKITHRKEEEVPSADVSGKPNAELHQLKTEMSKLAAGMVLEIETGSAKAIRGTKGLVTRASKQLGRPFVHWHQGTKVFAKPAEARRRGRPPKVQP